MSESCRQGCLATSLQKPGHSMGAGEKEGVGVNALKEDR